MDNFAHLTNDISSIMITTPIMVRDFCQKFDTYINILKLKIVRLLANSTIPINSCVLLDF